MFLYIIKLYYYIRRYQIPYNPLCYIAFPTETKLYYYYTIILLLYYFTIVIIIILLTTQYWNNETVHQKTYNIVL